MRKNFQSSLFGVSDQASGVFDNLQWIWLPIRLLGKAGLGKPGSGSQSCQVGEAWKHPVRFIRGVGQATDVRSSTMDLVIRLLGKTGLGKPGSGSHSCEFGKA